MAIETVKSGYAQAPYQNHQQKTGQKEGNPAAVDYMQMIKEKKQEILDKVKNGDTEPSFQIGAQSFTVKEWNRFLEKFDDTEDAVKELMREEQEKRARGRMPAEEADGQS